MGLTIEEFDQRKRDAKKSSKAANSTSPGGLTEEGRRRISESLKERWKNDEYRKKYVLAAGRNVSAETRAKISQAIKLKWQDEAYRAKCTSANVTLEQRQRISNTLKERWRTDEEFKARMKSNMTHQKTDAWKAVVSQKIKERWNDPEYRNKIVKTNRTRLSLNESDSTARQSSTRKRKQPSESSQAKASMQASRDKVAKSVQSKTQQISSKLLRDAQKSSREDVYAAAKRECRVGMQMTSTRTVREMLGEEYWAEEKARRSVTAKGGVIDDMALELALISEWSREDVPPEPLIGSSADPIKSSPDLENSSAAVSTPQLPANESKTSAKKTKVTTKRVAEESTDEETQATDASVDSDDEDNDEDGDYVIEYMGH